MNKLSSYLEQGRNPLLRHSIDQGADSDRAMHAIVSMRDVNWKSYIAQTLMSFMLKADEETLGIESFAFRCFDNAVTLEAVDRQGEFCSMGDALVDTFEGIFIDTDNPLFQDVLRTNRIVIHDSGVSMLFDKYNGITRDSMTRYLKQTLPGYRFGSGLISLNGETIARPVSEPKPLGEIRVEGPDHRGMTTFLVTPDPNALSITVSKRGIPLLQAPRSGGMGGILEIVETADHDPFMPTCLDMISGISDAIDPQHPCRLMDFAVKAYSVDKGTENGGISVNSSVLQSIPVGLLRDMTPDQIALLVETDRIEKGYRLYPFHVNAVGEIGGITLEDGKIRVPVETLKLIDRWRDAVDRAGGALGIPKESIEIGISNTPSTDMGCENNPYESIAMIQSDAQNWSDQKLDAMAARAIALIKGDEKTHLDTLTDIISRMSHDTSMSKVRDILRQSIKQDYVVLDTKSGQDTSEGVRLIDFIWPEVVIARDIPLLSDVVHDAIQVSDEAGVEAEGGIEQTEESAPAETTPENTTPENTAPENTTPTSASAEGPVGFSTQGMDDFMLTGFDDFAPTPAPDSSDLVGDGNPEQIEASEAEDVSEKLEQSAQLEDAAGDSSPSTSLSVTDALSANPAETASGFSTQGMDNLNDIFGAFDEDSDEPHGAEESSVVIIDTQTLSTTGDVVRSAQAMSKVLYQDEDDAPVILSPTSSSFRQP